MKKFTVKTCIAIFVIGILFTQIVPFIFKNIKFPLGAMDIIIHSMLPIIVIVFLFAIINAFRTGSKIRGKKINTSEFINISWPIICFILLGFITFMFGDLMASSTRIMVRNFLNNISDDATVCINGQFVKQPFLIINKLKKVSPITAHHTHALERFHIEVKSKNKSIRFEVGRDSKRTNEYWVFYPKYRYTRKNEIGRIRTGLFDDY